MAKLKDILYKVRILAVQGSTDVELSSLAIDSRQIKAGACFVAIVGAASNGHLFIDKAIESGATSIICESFPEKIKEGITYIQVSNTSEAIAYMAHQFYGEPSLKIKLVGVTGTNGKTTVATLLYKLFTQLGYKCGLLSTVQNMVAGEVLSATHTTPDAVSLNELLKRMIDAGCEYAFMECSSHAIHQHRITGLQFAGGIFTNITHDHLDYHKTFDEYIKVKKAFFDALPSNAFAITNIDDKRGAVMLQNTVAIRLSYSLKNMADYKGRIFENGLTGLVMAINDVEVHFKLIGEFNAYNLLAVYGAAINLGQDKHEVLQILSATDGAEGRFDYMVSPKENIVGIIDYAHTPDALLNVLATIKKLKQGHEKVITVVGCGGDRDKTKRPVMADVACEYSDQAIFTSDNPRTEDAQQIIDDMMVGLKSAYRRKQLSILDRREAMKAAVGLASSGDIILVAGKGHEKYQEIKGVKNHFDDKEELMEIFKMMGK